MDYFDWKYYIDRYEDLRKAGILNEAKAKRHWIRFGIKEKRICNKIFEDVDFNKYALDNKLNIDDFNNVYSNYYKFNNQKEPLIQNEPINNKQTQNQPINNKQTQNEPNENNLQLLKLLTNYKNLDLFKKQFIINQTLTNELDTLSINYKFDIKLIICTCIYKRYELTKYCIRKWLENNNIYKIIVTYSYDEDLDNLRDLLTDRLIIVKYDNLPLSDKWNYSVKTAQQYNPDGIMIMGSDDIFTDVYINKAIEYLKIGVEYISSNKWANIIFYDNKLLLFNSVYNYRTFNDGIGSSRIYSKNVLDKIDWELYKFKDPINKSLDGYSFKKISPFIKNSKFDIIEGYSVITLKIPTDTTAITIKDDVCDFIKKYYKNNEQNMTINNVIVLDYYNEN